MVKDYSVCVVGVPLTITITLSQSIVQYCSWISFGKAGQVCLITLDLITSFLFGADGVIALISETQSDLLSME